MLKKSAKFFAKYLLGGILPAALMSVIVAKLSQAPKNRDEHLDEVLMNAALVAVVMILSVGATLLAVRWLVVSRGVESGPLVLITAWLAAVAVMLLYVLSAFWTWKKYGFFYGVTMVIATLLATVILAAILVVLLIFFGFGLKLLRS